MPDAIRSCFNKARYETEEKATRVAVACWYKRQVNLRVYCCDSCGGFHLTSVAAEERLKPGYRPPAKSNRQLAYERDQEKRSRRRR